MLGKDDNSRQNRADFRIDFETSVSFLENKILSGGKLKGAFIRLVIHSWNQFDYFREDYFFHSGLYLFSVLYNWNYIFVFYVSVKRYLYTAALSNKNLGGGTCAIKIFVILITKGKKENLILVIILFNPVYLK